MKRPRCIALAVDGDEYGGAEQSLVHLLAHVGQGWEFVLVGPACAALEGLHQRLPDLAVVKVDTAERILSSASAFRRTFAELQPDLVQVTLCNPGAGLAIQAGAVAAGVPTIAVEQLVRPLKHRYRPIKSTISRLLVDHVAVGHASARLAERVALLPKGSIRTIHNGIPVGALGEPPPRPPAESDRRPRLVTVARLERQKGLDILLQAVAALDAEATIMGTGKELASLQAQAASLGIGDRVEFKGWVDDPAGQLHDYDLFVLPSRNEAFPLTIVEAMLRRLPVVATDVGSVAEAVIDGQTGFLVPPGDPVSLAEAIRRAMAQPGETQRIADAAHELAVGEFSAEAMAAAYEAMWRTPRGRTPLLNRAGRVL